MHAARTRLSFALALCCALVACEDESHSSWAAVARPALCARPGDDRVRDVFCGTIPPLISELRDVLRLFGLDPSGFDVSPGNIDPTSEIAAIGHSTALSGQLVTPLNPRLIFMGANLQLTFQRGVQRLEIATFERESNEVVLYLLTFQQPCNETEEGCSPGALYTPSIEHGWSRVRLEDDEDLKNTPSDCRQCHRRGLEKSQLLMRELESPWTHFFFPPHAGTEVPEGNGGDLMRDYIAAKGPELYGGVDLSKMSGLAPFLLQSTVDEAQPVNFDSRRIQNERWPRTPEGDYPTEVGESPTWESAYQAFKRGEQLALPYLELRATDRDKQAALAEAYQRYLKGEIEEDALPDMSDIYPDDPLLRARIGLDTEPDATPVEALIQACAPCHNDVLDQSISRASFNIGRLRRDEIDRAIDRIELPASTPGAMPPPEARQLAPAARERLLDYLRSEIDPDAIDPMLVRAAQLGMAGGGK